MQELIEITSAVEKEIALQKEAVTRPSSTFLAAFNPAIYPDWNELILQTPDQCFFHTANWARVLLGTYRYRPFYFARIEDNQLLDLLPLMEIKSLITGTRACGLPFSDYCPPIISKNTDVGILFEFIRSFGQKFGWKQIEIKGSDDKDFFYPSASFYRHILALQNGAEEIYAGLRGNYRSKIRKAEKQDVRIEIKQSVAALEEYYHLHCQTRKRHGLPPQPLRFFQKIYEHILSQNMGFVTLAYHNRRVIAGAVYFHFGKQMIYKFGASDAAYQHIPANYLSMWHAIQYACQKGFETFCFGRTERSNPGLIQFKDGWGAQKESLSYYTYNLKADAFKHGKQEAKKPGWFLFKKMPVSMLKLAGSMLYRHMG